MGIPYPLLRGPAGSACSAAQDPLDCAAGQQRQPVQGLCTQPEPQAVGSHPKRGTRSEESIRRAQLPLSSHLHSLSHVRQVNKSNSAWQPCGVEERWKGWQLPTASKHYHHTFSRTHITASHIFSGRTSTRSNQRIRSGKVERAKRGKSKSRKTTPRLH